MFRASARERASPQRFYHQMLPLYRALPKTISPPRSCTKRLPSRGTTKTTVPDCVPTGTVLCDVNKLGGLLNQSRCLEPNCQGFRRVVDCDTKSLGGVANFATRCSVCDQPGLFESGTYFECGDDERTGRYVQSALQELGTIFCGRGYAAYYLRIKRLGWGFPGSSKNRTGGY